MGLGFESLNPRILLIVPLKVTIYKNTYFLVRMYLVVPSAKGARDIERWELNWLYSLVQKILNALKIALVYKCLIFEKPHQFYNWKFSFLRVDAIFISFHDCEIIRRIWNKIYIIITVLTADSTVSAFWASSVQCWCLGWGLSLKSHPKCPTHVVHLSHASCIHLNNTRADVEL